jgi:hypothetical protein
MIPDFGRDALREIDRHFVRLHASDRVGRLGAGLNDWLNQHLWAVVIAGLLLFIGAVARPRREPCPDADLTPEQLAEAIWETYRRNLVRQDPERGSMMYHWHELREQERNSFIAASIVAISAVRARTR